VKLGPQVNSAADELVPVISPDGKTLYFTREGHPENYGYAKNPRDQDVWCSQLQSDGSWGKAIHLGSPVNSCLPNAIGGITADGRRVLLLGRFENGAIARGGYSISTLDSSGWSQPEGIDIPGYEKMDKGRTVTACLSEAGNMIIFSVSASADDTNHDLYLTTKVTGRTWSWPKPLRSLNTRAMECAPFLASDGRTLYFSSTRAGGRGDFDVYMARRLDESWERWSVPQNLGATVNTAGRDLYYTIPASGDCAYYASSAGSASTDICRVPLPPQFRPAPVALVSGRVIDARTSRPVQAEVVYETLSDGVEAGRSTTQPLTGEYRIILPGGRDYSYHASAEGGYSISERLDLTILNSYTTIRKDLSVVAIESGDAISLNNIYFDSDSSVLRVESKPELDRLVALLRRCPALSIQINGHTDNTGSTVQNLTLSAERAAAVRNYIINAGRITPKRVEAKGFGCTRPLATNDDDAGRQRNRRVDFIVLPQHDRIHYTDADQQADSDAPNP
jgi:outer membrane protein OmpA-like peptidoglycan-associated protein